VTAPDFSATHLTQRRETMTTTKLWLDRHDPAHIHHEPLDEETARLRAELDALRHALEYARKYLKNELAIHVVDSALQLYPKRGE